MSIGNDSTKRNPDCVVIDTNIWRSDLLLKTPMGESLIYALQRQRGRIGLPEVVEAELTEHVVELGLKAADELKKLSRIVSTLTDATFAEVPVPTRPELEKLVTERLVYLASSILIKVEFTFEQAKAALKMVIEKLPPNGPENQQFKDSLIWQAVLSLSRNYTVHLVSKDWGFFQRKGDPLSGLAPNLKEDCQAAELHYDLASCLKAITRDAPSFDQARLLSLIAETLMPRLQAEAARQRFRTREPADVKTQVFRTPEANRLAVDYVITVPLIFDAAVITDGRRDCQAIGRGSCYYNPETNSISGEFLWSLEFQWKHPSGGVGRMVSAFGSEDPSFPFPPPAVWRWASP